MADDNLQVHGLFGKIQSLNIAETGQKNATAADAVPANSTDIVSSTSAAAVTSCTSSEYLHNIRSRMLNRIADTDAHFKHQQLNEPDLTHKDKRAIAEDLLDKKLKTFLERFGKYIIFTDLPFLTDHVGSDTYASLQLREISKRIARTCTNDAKKIRNRRYEAMKRLVAGGEYFGDEEMKQREPLMYEQMIGQHLTESEISKMAGQSEDSLSGLLLKHLQVMQNNEIYDNQREVESDQLEEEEEEDENEENCHMDEDGDECDQNRLSDADRAALRCEFVTSMKEQFLKGEDRNFNYSEVDNNSDYDAAEILNRDAEDKYFNDDDGYDDNIDQGDNGLIGDDNEEYFNECNDGFTDTKNARMEDEKLSTDDFTLT